MKDRFSMALVILLTILRISLPYEIGGAEAAVSAALISEISVEDCARPPASSSGDFSGAVQPPAFSMGRDWYGIGNCRELSGKQTVVLFFLDDGESSWSEKDVRDFTDLQILPGLAFLMKEAAAWDVELSFEVKRYSTALSEDLELYTKIELEDHENRQINGVNLFHENLDSSKIICYPLKRNSQILVQNSPSS